MMTDTEIRVKGVAALSASLGSVEAERFIALIMREPFDYTRWQQSLFEDRSVADISAAAARRRSERDKPDPAHQGPNCREPKGE